MEITNVYEVEFSVPETAEVVIRTVRAKSEEQAALQVNPSMLMRAGCKLLRIRYLGIAGGDAPSEWFRLFFPIEGECEEVTKDELVAIRHDGDA